MIGQPMHNLSFSMHAAPHAPPSSTHSSQLLQYFDWMRDTTPAEEAEMKQHDWDLEHTKFGPVSERYRQPSLINKAAEHEALLREARTVAERVDAFNAGQRVRVLRVLHGHSCSGL